MAEFLKGKKTYFAALAGIVIALGGAYLGVISTDTAVLLFVSSCGVAGLRSGVTTEVAKALVARAADEGARRRSAPPPAPDTRKTSGGSF